MRAACAAHPGLRRRVRAQGAGAPRLAPTLLQLLNGVIPEQSVMIRLEFWLPEYPTLFSRGLATQRQSHKFLSPSVRFLVTLLRSQCVELNLGAAASQAYFKKFTLKIDLKTKRGTYPFI